MRRSWHVYAMAGIVFLLSIGFAWFLPTTDILRGLAGIPGVFALIAALYQTLRDQAAYDRQLDLQERQQFFNVGVASHMANVAFDKHVEFSEQYISKTQDAVTALFRDGPSKNTLTSLADLMAVRHKFRAWITNDVEARLLPFERALREIGAANIELAGIPPGDLRSKTVNQMFDTFRDLIGLPREGKAVDGKSAPDQIVGHLQELLGVAQLSRLRAAAIQSAIRTLEREA